MRRVALPLALLLPVAMVRAQEPVAGTPQSEYTALLAELDADQRRFRTTLQEVSRSAEYVALAKAGDRKATAAMRAKIAVVDMAAFAERFRAGADRYAGTEGAVDFLLWLATSYRDADAATAAASTLVASHAESPKLVKLAQALPRISRVVSKSQYAKLTAALAENGQDLVAAYALHGRVRGVLRDPNASDEDKSAVAADLQRAEKLAQGTAFADRIAAARFQHERLQMGMVVPDIEGEDLDGVPFKLSDYRGKVVVLDFWGDW